MTWTIAGSWPCKPLIVVLSCLLLQACERACAPDGEGSAAAAECDDDLDDDGILSVDDCDDTNPLLGGPESGDDGIDNDCDGAVDCDDDDLVDGERLENVEETDFATVCSGMCTLRVVGDVEISHQNNEVVSLIDDLSGLWCITEVTGSVIVFNNPRLTTLAGLHNLRTVGDNLVVQACDNLIDLRGLDSVQSAAGGLGISENHSLTSLDGLDGLRSVGCIGIDDNDMLVDVTALYGLTSVSGDVWFFDGNERLSDEAISALLAEIDYIGGGLPTCGPYAE